MDAARLLFRTAQTAASEMKRAFFRDLTWPLLALFGAGALYMALDFRFGTINNIGSAVYPLILSSAIVLISLYSIFFGRDGQVTRFDRRPFLAIVSAVILFSLVVERFGVVPAVVLSMIVAYAGQTAGNYRFVVVYAVLFAFGTWALFSYGLGLPLPTFRIP